MRLALARVRQERAHVGVSLRRLPPGGERVFDHFARALGGVELRLLRHIANAETAPHADRPAVGRLGAGEDPGEGGFPGPVRADEPHAFAASEGEGGVVEDHLRSERLSRRCWAVSAGMGGARRSRIDGAKHASGSVARSPSFGGTLVSNREELPLEALSGRVRAPLLLAAFLTLAPSARAADPTPLDALAEDAQAAFTSWPNLLLYGVAVGGTGAMAYGGGDQAVRVFAQEHLKSTAWGDAANAAGYTLPIVPRRSRWSGALATPVTQGSSGGGSAAIQAVGLTVATTFLLKWVTGRPYPLNGGDPNAPDVLDHPAYAHQFTPFNSAGAWAWPSGHTSAITSVVAALSAWDPDDLAIPLVGYPVATAIGLGMIAGDRHWTSDVISGGLIGYAIGSSVGRSFRRRAGGEREAEAALELHRCRCRRRALVGGAVAGTW